MAAERSIRRRAAGLYEHVSGALIVRTYAWEGPRGGWQYRWEIGKEDHGEIVVGDDGRLFRRLREVCDALDRKAAHV